MAAITLLIADGQRLFSECLARALRAETGIAVLDEHPETGPTAVEAASRLRPDLVLLDYWIPGGDPDGAAVTRDIVTGPAPPRVIVLSWMVGPQHAQAALEAGAVGYLPKRVSIDQLLKAVREAEGAEVVFGEELATLLEDLNKRSDEAEERWERLQRLTSREVQILELLSHGRPGPDIASELCIAPKTLRTAVHRILRKLGVETHLQAIAMARHHNLLATPGPQGTSVEADPRRPYFWTP